MSHEALTRLSCILVELGYSSKAPQPSLDELKRNGAAVEKQLENEPEAAPAPAQ